MLKSDTPHARNIAEERFWGDSALLAARMTVHVAWSDSALLAQHDSPSHCCVRVPAAQDINRAGSSPKGNGGAADIPIPPGDPYMYRFDNTTQRPLPRASRTSLSFFRSNYTRCGRGVVGGGYNCVLA